MECTSWKLLHDTLRHKIADFLTFTCFGLLCTSFIDSTGLARPPILWMHANYCFIENNCFILSFNYPSLRVIKGGAQGLLVHVSPFPDNLGINIATVFDNGTRNMFTICRKVANY